MQREPHADPAAVILASDALSWAIGAVSKFPRNLRYGLGARIEGALTDVLEGLVTESPGCFASRSSLRTATWTELRRELGFCSA